MNHAHRKPFPILKLHTIAVYIFLYLPIVVLVMFSFNRSDTISVWGGFSFRQYGNLLKASDIYESMVNSMIIGGITTVLATVIGTLAALAMSKSKFFGKAATGALLFLPIIIPEVVFGSALLSFFAATKWQLSIWTILIAHVTFSVSYVAIVVRARLAGFDPSLEEAARDLGAGWFDTFFRVKLPLIMPGILSGAILVFTLSIDDYVVTSFAAGTIKTLPLQIASMLHNNKDPALINAAATALLLVTVLLILLSQWLLSEKHHSGST